MKTQVTRKDIPPWVKIPTDLERPEVLQVNKLVLNALFGPQGSRMPHFEQVGRVMFELKTLESSDLTEILIYGSGQKKFRTKWMLQSMAERYRLRQERGMLKLEEGMKVLELDQGSKK
ncbi:developmental pluripotency-associated protein 5A-like [Grammomys surdaster]|uniref:developmental pluripotency-associated protein 5A-like n=1 Tax=Grammomys surdaster TaxID=491861 RepID=UPI00109F8AF8|nr:developmental pluripotency-associated protein 5A-like [Grammomys surdaster]